MNPVVTIYLNNGKEIVIEMLPEAAPNTVNSFLYVASLGCMDGEKIQRIVPGKWIDFSYTAFHSDEAKYLIPKEFELHPEIEPISSHPGCVCMGGYGEAGNASCEIFFPLKDCPEHKGIYPVIGRVVFGMEEILRLEQVPTRKVTNYPNKEIEVNEPLTPEIIEHVEVELNGYEPADVIRMEKQELPECWLMEEL